MAVLTDCRIYATILHFINGIANELGRPNCEETGQAGETGSKDRAEFCLDMGKSDCFTQTIIFSLLVAASCSYDRTIDL